jgi:hypothetical protein
VSLIVSALRALDAEAPASASASAAARDTRKPSPVRPSLLPWCVAAAFAASTAAVLLWPLAALTTAPPIADAPAGGIAAAVIPSHPGMSVNSSGETRPGARPSPVPAARVAAVLSPTEEAPTSGAAPATSASVVATPMPPALAKDTLVARPVPGAAPAPAPSEPPAAPSRPMDATVPPAMLDADTAVVDTTAFPPTTSPVAPAAVAATTPVASVSVRSRDSIDEAADARETRRRVVAFSAAVEAGDLASASDVLASMRQALPPRSLTLLRSEAWFALASDDVAGARRGYHALLARVPDDLNAGVAVVLLDARDGHFEAAERRLLGLSQRHGRAPELQRAQDNLRRMREEHGMLHRLRESEA